MPRSTKSIREGIASFELVMSFPILMFLIAMLYTVYVGTVKKSQLTMNVRHDAWMIRSTPLQAKSQAPFGFFSADSSGEARREMRRTVNTYRQWYPYVPRRIDWGNVVLAGSWDYRQIEFEEKGFSPIYPHLGILLDMASAPGGVKVNGGQISQLSSLSGFPGL